MEYTPIVMALIPAFALLLLWVLGVPVRYLACFFVAALLIDALTASRRMRLRGHSVASLGLMIAGWSVTIFTVEIVRFMIADQGIDFAIFTQAMGEYAVRGEFQTSLVGTRWVNFLTHHFSPLLMVPGLMASWGINVQIVAIALHAIAIGVALWGVACVGRERQLALGVIAVCVGALIMHPGLRIPALWEVHDEVYAAPFVIFGILLLERGRVVNALLCLALASLCKETMFLLAAACCAGALFGDLSQSADHRKFSVGARWGLAFGAVAFVSSFGLYAFVLPKVLFNPSFDFSARIASLQQLFDLQILRLKLWCVFTWLLFPVLIFLALHRGGSLTCRAPRAAGAAFVGLWFQAVVLALSNFDAMWNPYTYYQVLPVLLVGMLLIAVVPHTRLHRPSLVAAPLCLCFCFGAVQGPMGPLLQVQELSRNISEVDRALPQAGVVIASDLDTGWLVGSRQVMRTFHANRNSVRFDYIVLRKGRREPLAGYLRTGSRPCFENDLYKVRCARPFAAADPELVRGSFNLRVRLAQIPVAQRG